MSKQPTTQTVSLPAGADALVALYADYAERLQFPDMSHAVLLGRLEALDGDEEALREAEAAVERARTAVSAARRELAVAVRRGHAYARVYAEMNEDVRERVEAIVIDPPKRESRKRSKRAKAKTTATAAVQPLLDHAATSDAVASGKAKLTQERAESTNSSAGDHASGPAKPEAPNPAAGDAEAVAAAE